MKKSLSYIVLAGLLLLSTHLMGQPPSEVFAEGNRLYEQEAYDSAFQKYETLYREGYQNKELLLNMGNAQFKQGNYNKATFYFAKGLKSNPGNKTLRHNYELAQSLASNTTQQLKPLFFVRWWNTFIHFLGPNSWLVGSIVFFWLFIVLLLFRRFSGKEFVGIALLKRLSFLLFLVFFAGSIASYESANSHTSGIILSTTTSLRAAPDEQSEKVDDLQDAAKVKILDQLPDWVKIKLRNGSEGWVPSEALGVL